MAKGVSRSIEGAQGREVIYGVYLSSGIGPHLDFFYGDFPDPITVPNQESAYYSGLKNGAKFARQLRRITGLMRRNIDQASGRFDPTAPCMQVGRHNGRRDWGIRVANYLPNLLQNLDRKKNR
jgi:hypothetical protein